MADKILHNVLSYAPGIGEGNFNEPGDIVNKGYVDGKLGQKWRATATATAATLNLSLPQTLGAGLYKMTVFMRNAGNAARTFRARFNNISTPTAYLRGTTSVDYWDVFSGTIATLDSGLSQSLFFINTQDFVKGQLAQVVRGTNVAAMTATALQTWNTNLGANVGGITSVQIFSTEAGTNIAAGSFVEIERIG